MSGGQRRNWVDRGEAPDATLVRVLGHYLELPLEPLDSRLPHVATVVLGMVAAHAAEGGVAGYLASVEAELGRPTPPPGLRRMTAVACWHIAKVAEVREAAIARLSAPPPAAGTRLPLAEWLAGRLLTPEEQAAYAAERAQAETPEAAT